MPEDHIEGLSRGSPGREIDEMQDSDSEVTRTRWIPKAAPAWALILGAGALVLVGRYDWTEDVFRYSLRGYLSSLYMFVFTVPITYYLVRFFVSRPAIARNITLTVGIVLVLPYKWTGLDRWYYHRDAPTFWKMSDPNIPPPEFDWLPGALLDLRSIPHEIAFFTALLALGALVFMVVRRKRRRAEGFGKKGALLFLALYFGIVAQSWLHLSMRNPGVYILPFKRVEALAEYNYFRLLYLLPDSRGAVSTDYVPFRELEEHFMGLPKETRTLYIRRSFLFYLSSQFSYFFSPYYVFLVLNVVLWFAAAVCAYRFAKVNWNDQVAKYYAILTSCGSGFIFFVASPRSYLASYAEIIILICLFEEIMLRQKDKSAYGFLLFGGVLGLGAMVYDIFPMYAFFLIYALLRRVLSLKLLASIGVSILMSFGFVFLQRTVLHLRFSDANSRFLSEPFLNMLSLVRDFDPLEVFSLTVDLPRVYFGSLGQVFLYFPLLLAFLGLCFSRDRRRLLALCLALPSVFVIIFFHYGQATFRGVAMAEMPRFAYFAYPSVYFLAAVALFEIGRIRTSARLSPLLMAAAPWFLLCLIVLLNNVDAFGFPEIYLTAFLPR